MKKNTLRVISFLIIALAIAFGIYFYLQNTGSQTEDESVAGDYQRIELTNESDEEIATETYDDLARPLTFQFPDAWNVYTKANVEFSGLTTVELGPEPLGDAREWGGYFGNDVVRIDILRFPVIDPSYLNRYSSYPTTIEEAIERFEKNSTVEIVSRTEQELENGTLVDLVLQDAEDVVCDVPGGCKNPREELIFVPDRNTSADGKIIFVVRTWKGPVNAETDAGWELIKSTLDFSEY